MLSIALSLIALAISVWSVILSRRALLLQRERLAAALRPPEPAPPIPETPDVSRFITTIQVFASLGIAATNEQTWTVGNRMQRLWVKEHGAQPPKDNRQKTNGPGSHCFALYPPEWRPRIVAEIARVMTIERSQLDMFPEE